MVGSGAGCRCAVFLPYTQTVAVGWCMHTQAMCPKHQVHLRSHLLQCLAVCSSPQPAASMQLAPASPANTSSHLAPGGSLLTVPACARIMSKMAERTCSMGGGRGLLLRTQLRFQTTTTPSYHRPLQVTTLCTQHTAACACQQCHAAGPQCCIQQNACRPASAYWLHTTLQPPCHSPPRHSPTPAPSPSPSWGESPQLPARTPGSGPSRCRR